MRLMHWFRIGQGRTAGLIGLLIHQEEEEEEIVAGVPNATRSTLPSLPLLKDLADMEGEEKVRRQ